eukprot:COSAG02_NODE_71932_length_189_cov_13.277778_1_plen_21_part_10
MRLVGAGGRRGVAFTGRLRGL